MVEMALRSAGIAMTVWAVFARGSLSWAADPRVGGSAAELVRQGRERAEQGDAEVALHRFAEAVQLDPTYGPAYLELGSMRERLGDLREAERTYTVAIEHVPQFVAAFRARATVLARLGQPERELADLETVAKIAEEADAFRALAQRYAEDRAWPAALAVWRRAAVVAETNGDESFAREAAVQMRALVVLCAELDPVAAGITSRDWVRRAEASVARRRAH